MTLILFYGNKDFACIAADRRLTYPNLTTAENDHTKLLSLSGALLFGFTGQAYIRRQGEALPSLMWFAHAIKEQATPEMVDTDLLAEKLTRDARLPSGPAGRLAFGAIGFIERKLTTVLISNMHTNNGLVLPSGGRRPEFASVVAYHESVLQILGGGVAPQVRRFLDERLAIVGHNPKAVEQVLAGAIERSNSSTVSKQCLTAIARPCGPDETSVVDCNVIIPNFKGPLAASDLAMPILVSGGAIMAIHHEHREWPDL